MDRTTEEFGNGSFDPVHPLTGPAYVEGAEPSDVLEVELLESKAGSSIPGEKKLPQSF